MGHSKDRRTWSHDGLALAALCMALGARDATGIDVVLED